VVLLATVLFDVTRRRLDGAAVPVMVIGMCLLARELRRPCRPDATCLTHARRRPSRGRSCANACARGSVTRVNRIAACGNPRPAHVGCWQQPADNWPSEQALRSALTTR